MPRALWSGTLSFGLVNVPVRLHSAVRDHDLRFHLLHREDGARIETRRFCEREDAEVGWDEIGHGYERRDGTQVVLTDEELQAIAPKRTRTIEIGAFVDVAEIDPVLYDHPYLLVPAGEAEGVRRAYRLLVEVMRDRDQAAIGRIVLRTKEHLVAVRVRDGLLALTTMCFHDEVRPTTGIDTGGRRRPTKQALDRAVRLVEALGADWDPERYEDRYRARLQRVVRRKRRGQAIAPPPPEVAPPPPGDLMAALEESLAEVRGPGKGRRATAAAD